MTIKVRLGEWKLPEFPDSPGSDRDCLPPDFTKCLRYVHKSQLSLLLRIVLRFSPVQEFTVKKSDVFVHEEYGKQQKTIANDIALVKLDRPAELNNGTQLVCLPTQPDIAAAELGVSDIR